MGNMKKKVLFVVLGGLAALPLAARAQNISDALALYTPANIASYFPGYSPAVYSYTAGVVQTQFTTNPNCIAWFNSGAFFTPATFSAQGTACTVALGTQFQLFGPPLSTVSDFSSLIMILATYAIQVLTPIVSLQVQQSTTIRQAEVLSKVLGGIGSRPQAAGPQRVALDGRGSKGLAGGGAGPNLNGWISVTGNQIANDFKGSGYDGDVKGFIGGVDYTLGKDSVVGVSLASERTDLVTPYNNGSLGAKSWTLAPYLSYRFSERLTLDASAGYAWGNQHINWRFGTASRSANQNLSRKFIAANLNAERWIGDWQLSGKAGAIRAEEQLDANESLLAGKTTNRLTQLKLSGRAGCWISDMMPYASLAYTRDIQQGSQFDKLPSELKDKDGWTASLGLDLFSRQGITGGLMYSEERGRTHLTNKLLMGNLSVRF